MKQRDRHVRGDGRPVQLGGSFYVDEAGLGKAAIYSPGGNIHSEIRFRSD